MRHLYLLAFVALGLPAAAQSGPAPTPPADSVRYWATPLKAGLNTNEALLSKNRKSGGTSSLGLSPSPPFAIGGPRPVRVGIAGGAQKREAREVNSLASL